MSGGDEGGCLRPLRIQGFNGRTLSLTVPFRRGLRRVCVCTLSFLMNPFLGATCECYYLPPLRIHPYAPPLCLYHVESKPPTQALECKEVSSIGRLGSPNYRHSSSKKNEEIGKSLTSSIHCLCHKKLYTAHQKGCGIIIAMPPAQTKALEKDLFVCLETNQGILKSCTKFFRKLKCKRRKLQWNQTESPFWRL